VERALGGSWASFFFLSPPPSPPPPPPPPPPAPGGRLLVLADPAPATPVTATPVTATRAHALETVFAAAGATGALPGARREARRVARYAPLRELRTGHHATEDALLRTDLRDVALLHIASHAVVDDASPLRTAIALAPSNGSDGFLTAMDIATLDLRADLVVLSGCRTARGRVIGGEGLQGLAGPFLAAGARALVASHWEVRDNATVALMDDLYAALARGAPAADALADAQRHAIARGDPPAVWAAFTLLGDPMAAPPLETPRGVPLVRTTLALLALLSAGAAARQYARRRNTLTDA
jgi:CHAT domain-containing protein